MTSSIKARLLLLVIGGMAVLLAVFTFVVYGAMYRSLTNDFDGVLLSIARTISNSVERSENTIKADIEESEMTEFHRAVQPDYFQIWKEDGAVLSRSTSLKGADLSSFGGESAPAYRSVQLPDGRPGRAVGIVFVPKVDDEAKNAAAPQKVTLVVARGTKELNSRLEFILWLLISVTGGTVILALLVSIVVVRQGLKPLDALAIRIAAIRQNDLSTQVPLDSLPAELVPVVRKLNDLLRRLDEAFRRERAFTADAAHELRTPLAGIRSTLEVTLRRSREGGEYRQAIKECLDIVQSTQTMTDNLLELARLEGRHMALHPEKLVLKDIIESAWRPFSDAAEARGITVDSHVPTELVCTADRHTLAMILTNIFANAAEYTNHGGRIEIAARPLDETVEFTVANTGSQVSEEDAAQLFERFWRGDKSRAGTGTHCGLGLALVQRAAASLGGAVTAASVNGRFVVCLNLPGSHE